LPNSAACPACRQEQHLFLLDQLAHLLHRARRTVAVVQADEVDLAPLIPPWSLIILKYAASARPMVP